MSLDYGHCGSRLQTRNSHHFVLVSGDRKRCVYCGYEEDLTQGRGSKLTQEEQTSHKRIPRFGDKPEEIEEYEGLCRGCGGPTARRERDDGSVIEECAGDPGDGCNYSMLIWDEESEVVDQ